MNPNDAVRCCKAFLIFRLFFISSTTRMFALGLSDLAEIQRRYTDGTPLSAEFEQAIMNVDRRVGDIADAIRRAAPDVASLEEVDFPKQLKSKLLDGYNVKWAPKVMSTTRALGAKEAYQTNEEVTSTVDAVFDAIIEDRHHVEDVKELLGIDFTDKTNRPKALAKLLRLAKDERNQFKVLVDNNVKWTAMVDMLKGKVNDDGVVIVLKDNGQLSVDPAAGDALRALHGTTLFPLDFTSQDFSSEVTNEHYDSLKPDILYDDQHQDVFVQYLTKKGKIDSPVVILPCQMEGNGPKVLFMSTHLNSGDSEKDASERQTQATQILALKTKLLGALGSWRNKNVLTLNIILP